MSFPDKKAHNIAPSIRKLMSGDHTPHFTPEFSLFVRESKLGITESIIYHVFPVPVQRLLGRVLPKSETVSKVLETTDFREKYGLRPGHVSPQLQGQDRD